MANEVRDLPASSGPNPYVFLVGCPKSGLTLLSRILDAHPALAVAPELDWLTDYYTMRTGLLPDAPVFPELVSKWTERKQFDPFGLDRDAVTCLVPSKRPVPYREFVARLLDLYGRDREKRLVGSKTPEYVCQLNAVHQVWPMARFLHLIRDGRDVCATLIEADPARYSREREPLATAALAWGRRVRQGREAGRALAAGLYHEVRYEELTQNPAEVCARLCAFLDLPFDSAMLRFHEGRTRHEPGLDAKNAWQPIRPGLRDWRTQLPTADVERFEAVAGDLLRELGYERADPSSSASRLGLASMSPSELPALPSEPRLAESGQPLNPFVFLIGCQRSGTTLLRRMVNAHPQIAILPETRWIPAYFKAGTGLTPQGLVLPEFIPRLFEHPRFYKLRVGPDELRDLLQRAGPLPYPRLVSILFDIYGDGQAKRLVGDKTPRYVRHVARLHALWPDAKFVHLIRDGRDVALSLVNWRRKGAKMAKHFSTWREDGIGTAAALWEWHVRQGREAGRALAAGLYHEMRYEELTTNPVEVCARLCAFLGLPYDSAMLRFHEGRTRHEPGLDAKNAWQPITPGLRDWRTQMSDTDVQHFEAAAGDLLEELGYARGFPVLSTEAIERANQIREAFIRHRPDRKAAPTNLAP